MSGRSSCPPCVPAIWWSWTTCGFIKAPTIALIQSAGADVRFLPPYSPDLNPIEKMWSKVKASLRRTAARTHEKLLEAIAGGLDAVTSRDARKWFASCGYAY
jgi:transposase